MRIIRRCTKSNRAVSIGIRIASKSMSPFSRKRGIRMSHMIEDHFSSSWIGLPLLLLLLNQGSGSERGFELTENLRVQFSLSPCKTIICRRRDSGGDKTRKTHGVRRTDATRKKPDIRCLHDDYCICHTLYSLGTIFHRISLLFLQQQRIFWSRSGRKLMPTRLQLEEKAELFRKKMFRATLFSLFSRFLTESATFAPCIRAFSLWCPNAYCGTRSRKRKSERQKRKRSSSRGSSLRPLVESSCIYVVCWVESRGGKAKNREREREASTGSRD